VLEQRGHQVDLAADGVEALSLWDGSSYDLVISDINMPNLSGVDLLCTLRQRGLNVPVILVTAEPEVDSARCALEYGALRYLAKPVVMSELLATVDTAIKFNEMAKLHWQAARLLGAAEPQASARGQLDAALERAMGSLWMAYQPILDVNDHKPRAFEALVRTREQSMERPDSLFPAAQRLGRVHHLGRRIRTQVAKTIDAGIPCRDIFVNLHPSDIFDDDLYDADAALSRSANRIVLEVTERSALEEGAGLSDRVRLLRELGYRIAVDDLGAGYAGLNYLALLEPEVVKLDVALIRDIHAAPLKRKLVGSMIELCKDLGIFVVAEGVEKEEERDTLLELGCDLLQGFLFGKPGAAFPKARWGGAPGSGDPATPKVFGEMLPEVPHSSTAGLRH
jgi:EAL domain-containing protein (putative c-di-GMP-specific phosphodiesterase class I)